MKKISGVIFVTFVITVLLVAVYRHIISLQENDDFETVSIQDEKYLLGDILVDFNNRTVSFDAKVNFRSGPALFLVALRGYNWIRDESAILGKPHLIDLQKAVALMDREAFDGLWRNMRDDYEGYPEVYLNIDGEDVSAYKFILAEERLYTSEIIFFGSPFFDAAALQTPDGVDCRACPLFHLEEQALMEVFARPGGRIGFKLKEDMLPEERSRVRIILLFPDPEAS